MELLAIFTKNIFSSFLQNEYLIIFFLSINKMQFLETGKLFAFFDFLNRQKNNGIDI